MLRRSVWLRELTAGGGCFGKEALWPPCLSWRRYRGRSVLWPARLPAARRLVPKACAVKAAALATTAASAAATGRSISARASNVAPSSPRPAGTCAPMTPNVAAQPNAATKASFAAVTRACERRPTRSGAATALPTTSGQRTAAPNNRPRSSSSMSASRTRPAVAQPSAAARARSAVLERVAQRACQRGVAGPPRAAARAGYALTAWRAVTSKASPTQTFAARSPRPGRRPPRLSRPTGGAAPAEKPARVTKKARYVFTGLSKKPSKCAMTTVYPAAKKTGVSLQHSSSNRPSPAK